MLDDGDYNSHREVNSRGWAPREGYSKMLCVVYVCDDRNIHTRARTQVHIDTDTQREKEKEREIWRETYVHTHVDNTQTHARVNR